MIRLEHVNLVVKNMAATLDFIQTAFPAWKVRGKGESEWYGKKRKWLHVGTDEYYITLNEGNGEKNRDLKGHSPGLAHVGFVVDDMAEISNRLQAKGYEIATIGPDHPHRKTIYFIDPSGFEFEFMQYLSKKPEEKNMYGGETSPITRVSTARQGDEVVNSANFIKDLYKNAVDGKDADHLATFLTDDVHFRLGNHQPVRGKSAVLDANRTFFSSITSMSHVIENIWSQRDDLICNGSVDYVRLDGSAHSATFVTVLKLKEGKIADYLVYADLSQL